ncbi:LysR family transcriptional regulator [Streptomyces vilmorinianum]|uniref:LysR family transcriptional regulator n=1 Tax=Streptomyces vilmorinianum TaxID=3051092 RepID=UPI0010FB77BC|nr:LysR family transcriptional regulator [Streptomyces vilmorinianum]
MEDPTVHQLRLLLTLAEELHFKRAASKLYLSQPALSQQIRSLEQRLGVQFFTRTSRSVELTPTGQALLPLVRKVVNATEHLRNAASRSALGDTRLRLGVCENVAALEATRSVLGALSALYPCMGPEIHVLDFVEQMTALENGTIDAAFAYLPVPEGMHSQPLTTEPRVVCVASSDPLATRSSVTLADLAGYPVVSLASQMFQEGRDFWAADPRPDGTPVNYTSHHVTRFESLLSMASFGGAIAFVPSAAARLYPRPDIRYLPVRDLPDCTLGVVWPTVHRDKPQITALEDICRQLHRTGLPTGDAQNLTPLLELESAYC